MAEGVGSDQRKCSRCHRDAPSDSAKVLKNGTVLCGTCYFWRSYKLGFLAVPMALLVMLPIILLFYYLDLTRLKFVPPALGLFGAGLYWFLHRSLRNGWLQRPQNEKPRDQEARK